MSDATSPGDDTPRSFRSILFGSALGPFLGLVLVFGLFAGIDAVIAQTQGKRLSFSSVSTCQKLLRDSTIIGVGALGMTLIIISGGIDLSAGTAVSLCATVMAWLFLRDLPTPVVILCGIATGCFIGCVNGALITSLRLVPFIVTLGMMTILRGIGLIFSKDSRIDAAAKAPEWIYESQSMFPIPKWLMVSSGVWITLFLALAVGVLLKYSVFGRRIYAVGSNESTARLCGINVVATRIAVYATAGLFVGVAGLFHFAFVRGDVNPNAGMGMELEMIAAVVIGGGSLNGGRGSVAGTLAGAAIMVTIQHGCTTLGIGTKYQQIILGVIIIAAVTLDQLRQRRMGSTIPQ